MSSSSSAWLNVRSCAIVLYTRPAMSKEGKKPKRKAPVAPNSHVQLRNKVPKDSANGGGGAKNLRYSHLLEGMVGCGDMVLLEPLTEESLLENLKTRYDSGEIYVSEHMLELVRTLAGEMRCVLCLLSYPYTACVCSSWLGRSEIRYFVFCILHILPYIKPSPSLPPLPPSFPIDIYRTSCGVS